MIPKKIPRDDLGVKASGEEMHFGHLKRVCLVGKGLLIAKTSDVLLKSSILFKLRFVKKRNAKEREKQVAGDAGGSQRCSE